MMMEKNGNRTVRIFSARACAAPLEGAARLFEEKTGIHVEIDVCSRHCAAHVAEEATGETGGDDFLLEISDAGIHDLAIAGAEYLLDDGEVRGIVQRGQRRTIAYRTSAIIVPAGNPAISGASRTWAGRPCGLPYRSLIASRDCGRI